jgi:hypothetical protein
MYYLKQILFEHFYLILLFNIYVKQFTKKLLGSQPVFVFPCLYLNLCFLFNKKHFQDNIFSLLYDLLVLLV